MIPFTKLLPNNLLNYQQDFFYHHSVVLNGEQTPQYCIKNKYPRKLTKFLLRHIDPTCCPIVLKSFRNLYSLFVILRFPQICSMNTIGKRAAIQFQQRSRNLVWEYSQEVDASDTHLLFLIEFSYKFIASKLIYNLQTSLLVYIF